MEKNDYPFSLEKLFLQTGKWYPLLMLVFVQCVSTPLLVLLTIMPTQDTVKFSAIQGPGLLVFGVIALLFRNALLLALFYISNRDMFTRLAGLGKSLTPENTEQEKRAWEQVTSASKRLIFHEFASLLVLVLVPTLLYGYFNLHLRYEQLAYFSLATIASGIAIFLLENLSLDQLFEPVIQVLLPAQFETQLIGFKGMRLPWKLAFAIIGLVILGILLTVPTAYHQTQIISADSPRSPELLMNALWTILRASIGAVVISLALSWRLVSYFSSPFRRMTNMLDKVEKGDLSWRINVSFPDEFGKLSIFINHTIDRLQMLASTLEQQVAERTVQLSQANEQLLVELTERMHTEEKLAYTALHDPLTNLPNRVLFMDRLQHTMERSRRHANFNYVVIFIDLDRFKVVNDSLGHNIGDMLLVECARRLEACVRGEDTVARLSGDEFVILLEELVDPLGYIRVADRIQNDLAAPANLAGHKVFISLSMGIVSGNERYEDPNDILRDADIAMYRAKQFGRGRYEVFDTSMLEHMVSRMQMETDLRKGMENHEFVIHYQPILNLANQHIVGFEALVRWQHPSHGLILPAEFLQIADEISLIIPLGYWILDEACRQISTWQAQYPADPPLTINVNLFKRQCAEADLVERIAATLTKYNLDAGSLVLEMTESLIIEDSESTRIMLAKLHKLGIQVHIDDFGTAYSALGALRKLSINTLKIDRTFTSQMETTHSGREIVRTILSLAQGLGMQVIAEGVETEDQISKLREMNCNYVQGFLFARPVDSQEAGALLEKSFKKTDG